MVASALDASSQRVPSKRRPTVVQNSSLWNSDQRRSTRRNARLNSHIGNSSVASTKRSIQVVG